MSITRIKDWKICAKKEDIPKVKDDLVFFLGNKAMNRLVLSPNKCYLAGKVFGKEGFENGEEVQTSAIKRMDRVINNNTSSGDLLCVTTISDSTYYISLSDRKH